MGYQAASGSCHKDTSCGGVSACCCHRRDSPCCMRGEQDSSKLLAQFCVMKDGHMAEQIRPHVHFTGALINTFDPELCSAVIVYFPGLYYRNQ